MRYSIILAVSIFILFPAFAVSATLKVPSQYPEIQDAIDASVNGDTVLVEPGTYYERIDFKGKAITVTSEQGADVTIIHGFDLGEIMVTCQSGEGPDSVLDGFSIIIGPYVMGRGMYNYISSPTVTNCTFSCGYPGYTCAGGMWNIDSSPMVTNCTFSESGSGMYNSNNSSPTVTQCTFTRNSATSFGGGMGNYNSSPIVTNCIFSGNSGGPNGGGGGMANYGSSPMVTNCTFSGNSAFYGGGGMANYGSSPMVTNCTFSGNSAYVGGGMYNEDNSSPMVTNCTFSGNSATSFGGGMYNEDNSSPMVTNCTFSGNSAFYGGGGMANYGSSPMVTNCTFSGNSAYVGGGGMFNEDNSSPMVTNTVFWNNDAREGPEILIGILTNPSTLTIRYSNVEGGQSAVYIGPNCTLNWGAGMIDSNPLFVDLANGDFHLTFNSPCRGSGDNAAVIDLYDFEGDPRIAYGTVDMGADEFYTHLYWTGDATPGGNVEIKFVGLPGTSPVGLCIGTGVLDPPISSMWGDWYLQFPIIGPMDMGSITSPEGVLVVPGTIPMSPPAPYSLPMQALIGAELTNLSVLEIK